MNCKRTEGCANLVKTGYIDHSADIDDTWIHAKYTAFLQPVLSEGYPHCHRNWQGRGDSDGDQVQRTPGNQTGIITIAHL